VPAKIARKDKDACHPGRGTISDGFKPKNRFAISRKSALVEAAGIEPASRDVSEQTSTCVFGQLKSHEDTPGRQGVAFTSPEQI